MTRIRLNFFYLIMLFIATQSCALKSVFQIEPDENKGNVFQYCGGQEWGYIKQLEPVAKSPYLAVFLENNIFPAADAVVFNFVIQVQSDSKITFKDKNLKIYRDDQLVVDKPISFWIIQAEKQIEDRYSSNNYSFKLKNAASNEWEVRKKKYGGFFGEMALEEPIVVKINKIPNEEKKDNPINVKFDILNDNSIYIMNKLVIPFKEVRIRSGLIKIRTPAFQLNEIFIHEANYIFYFDQERLVKAMKDSNSCASLEQIFQWARNKNSWIWWMEPRITN